MAKTIPQLTDATTVNAADELIIHQGGVTKRTTAGELTKSINTLNGALNVKDFGAIGNGSADDYPAFASAISALPNAGGTITVPAGTYLLSSEPTWDSKSIFWDISVGAIFTGSGTGDRGKFPNIATNIGNIAAGPWVLSQTTQAPTFDGAAVNAATFEIIAPSNVSQGMYVGLYAGGRGSSASTTNNVWAANTVVEALAGSKGAYFGLEIDVISHSLDAITRGLLVSGHGDEDADVAIEIDRNLVIGDGTWFYGLTTKAAQNAIHINVDATLVRGISFSNSSVFPNSLFSGKQIANNTAAVVIQRNTDTSPLGDLLRMVNAANSSILFNVDASGNLGTSGFVKSSSDIWSAGGALKATNAAGTVTYFDVRSTGVLAGVLPTSPVGLPSGSLWVDTGAGNVVKRV